MNTLDQHANLDNLHPQQLQELKRITREHSQEKLAEEIDRIDKRDELHALTCAVEAQDNELANEIQDANSTITALRTKIEEWHETIARYIDDVYGGEPTTAPKPLQRAWDEMYEEI